MIACPSLAQWQAVLSQGLSGPEEETFSQHVLACASCQTALETLTRSERLPGTWLAHAAMDTPTPVQASTNTPPHGPPQDPFRTVDFRHVRAPAENGPLVPGYEILEELGRGGMGVVFKARHLELNRLVALKMLRDGALADTGMLARFRDEARAVARLQHPGIVQIHEIGALEGQPFLALEYVPGRSLERQLQGTPQPPRDAAALMVPLAEAIHAAHLQGILHRDLKPANVLLTFSRAPEARASEGEARASGARLNEAVLKITDFGLAKPLDEDTGRTETGVVAGTPSYMAPEQAAGQKRLGPAVDIYALGAILYEMLTGRPPFKGVTAYDTVHLVLTTEPVPPRRLQPQVPRDLETICLKCLHKEPARRYLTAKDVAEDVQRFLAGRPILARPATRLERVIKWCRRYPAVAALLVVATLASILASGLAIWAFSAERQAVHAAAAEKAANQQSQKRLTQVARANDILGSIFENLDPNEIEKADRPLQAILVEQLDKAVAQLEGESIGDPLVVAAMQKKFARSLRTLGEARKAILLLEKACATYQTRLGPDHPDTLASNSDLAESYENAGQLDLALPLFTETFRRRKARLGPDHPDTLTVMNHLAGVYIAAGKLDLALPLQEEALKLRKARLGPDHRDTLQSMNDLAVVYWALGKLDLALPLQEETLKLRKAHLGPNHADTVNSMNNLAVVYRTAGKLDLAQSLLEEAIKISIAKRGTDDPGSLALMHNLAKVQCAAKLFDKSIPLFEETLKRQAAKLGRGHPATLLTMANLGVNYRDMGRLKEAIPLLEEAYQAGQKYPEVVGRVEAPLFDAYAKAGETAKVAHFLQGELPEVRKRLDSRQLTDLLAQMGMTLLEQNQWTEAEPLLRECLTIRTKTQPDAWTTYHTQSLLGEALRGQKKYDEAESLLLQGYAGMKQQAAQIPPQEKPRLAEAAERLAQHYTATARPEEAAKWKQERETLRAVADTAP